MALLVVLVPAELGDLPLHSTAIAALARLGVTSIALARDEQTAAVILEGWAFDATRPNDALNALGTIADRTRALQPVMQIAVATTATASRNQADAKGETRCDH
jgi:hypothetical protein